MDTSEDFDINKVIAEVISSQVEAVYDKLKTTGLGGVDAIRIRMKSAYSDYLKKLHKEFSIARSFFLRDTPCDLYSFYVPAGVTGGKNKIASVTSRSLEAISNRVVICGQAGCGKSILLRHLLLDSISDRYKVPVYCELKDLNDSDTSIEQVIVNALEIYGFKIHDAARDIGFEKGHFIFLFDGYDELDPSRRLAVSQQILVFAKKNPLCSFVLTSRPDPEFSGWDGFSRVDVTPLSLEKSCALVEKLPVDGKLKKRFLDDLKDHLYKDHFTFLSNPLLLTIMLLTYDENADIPRKLSVFYNQAYEALFQRHDARKGAYKRKRKTSLDIQDFGKIFSAFCLLTYDRRLLRFSEADGLTILANAREIVEISFSAQDYLTDLMQATCLLIEDGLFLTFAHRSFQEYFVARFIHEAPIDKKELLIRRYRPLLRRDNTIALLYEMDPHAVEKVIVIPVMDLMLQKIGPRKGRRNSHTRYLAYLDLIYQSIGLMDGQVTGWLRAQESEMSQFFDVASLLLRRLGHLHGTNNLVRNDKRVIEAILATNDHNPNVGIPISKISPSSELAKSLFESENFCGGKSFDKLLQVYEQIQVKHRNRTESLDSLLQTPRNHTAQSSS